ncbi:MAG: arylesterase [Luteimonas sp.]
MKAIHAARRGRFQWSGALLTLLLGAWVHAQSPQSRQPAQPTPATPPTVLVMGDSLSAAYGLQTSEGWVALTAERIANKQPDWRVVNASISGETSAGGSSRVVAEVLRVRPTVLVIELGANDALRGLPLRELRRNLARMIGAAQYAGAKVLLVGMRIPPNYGPDYARGFEQTYRDLAQLFGVALLPFMLEPIATDRSAFQADNMHPIAGVQPKIRDHVWTQLAPMLK